MAKFCPFRCVGGWAPVNDEYVARQLAKLPEHADEEVRSAVRALLRDSVYPCPTCRPEQYELWSGGHFAPDHTCESCVARRKSKGRGRALAGPRT